MCTCVAFQQFYCINSPTVKNNTFTQERKQKRHEQLQTTISTICSMIESATKTSMPIQTPDLYSVYDDRDELNKCAQKSNDSKKS